MHEAAESAGHVGPAVPEATGRASAGGEAPEQLGGGEAASVRWTPGAEARLANIPAFVRPMARVGIEGYARERGAQEIDETILDAARDYFGM
jgi:hypothetical protein